MARLGRFFTIAALAAGLGAATLPAGARTATVRGYVKPSTGHYVAPHVKTTPNRTRLDNYSTRGNVNPYTGKAGTKKP